MKKQHVIALIIAIVVIISICLIVIFKVNKSGENVENKVENTANLSSEIDWDNIQVTTATFKFKNSTGKDISKIYIRNNRSENFSDELSGEIKKDEEKEVSYGNYAPYYSWDMKFVFADGTEKTLNSMLAANQLYNGATLELVDLPDTIDAINHEMGTLEEVESPEGVPAETEEQENPANEEDETAPEETTTEETAEGASEETTEEAKTTEETVEEATEETIENN